MNDLDSPLDEQLTKGKTGFHHEPDERRQRIRAYKELAQTLASEQSRWLEINTRLDDLERGLPK